MTVQLVVLKPFLGFKRGDRISDAATIAKVLTGPQATSVVRVTAKEV